ncbi:MAG: hypoxanthine phosphoribosyltransferase [Thermodesulfobacteriota bacterium]|nr:hypoxanthine phosphoribosyltransferase [Thermodesulfobacteriota bacterium]
MKQLYSKDYISAQVSRIGKEISRDYRDSEILLVVILKGAMLFAADLAREITCPVTIDFMRVSSYGANTSSSGEILLKTDIEANICGKHVIIIEDIIDTGLTLQALTNHLQQRSPASLKVCTLINKKKRRVSAINVDYSGIIMDDGFIVGYGLDYNEHYRNLDAIYQFDPNKQLP